jgi:hypothetical protein
MSSASGARTLAAGVALLFVAQTICAAPAHVIRFAATDARQVGDCERMGWHDTLTFYNTTDTTATVRILGISNGTPAQMSPDHIDLPPGNVVWADLVLHSAWEPGNSTIWIMHLDVPEGVVIESRDEMFERNACVASPSPPFSLGKISLPVFRASVPANQTQIHLGTDLGAKDVHINVGIYNQSQIAANAHIEVRRSCDNFVVDSRDVQIAPDTIVQVTGLHNGSNIAPACGTSATVAPWLRYTVVSVDEPSMTFATVVGESLNAIPGLAPEIGLGIPTNARY